MLWVPAARAANDVAKVGQDIVVPEGETAGDIACAFCSVRVHGDVKGDIAVAFGNLDVDSEHQVSGDVAVLAGHVGLGDGSRIGGDVAVVGRLHEGEDVTVRGSRAVLPAALLLAPFLLLAGVVWLVVFLVRRSRYRPMYPPGYPGHRM
jgi:predicted acyltransferase (DUF342 family)